MKESRIRNKVTDALEKKGFYCWYAPKVRYHSTDVFKIFDVLAVKPDGKIWWIQLTTASNVSARRKKIQEFLEESGAEVEWYITAWDNKNKVIKVWKDGGRQKDVENKYFRSGRHKGNN